MKTGMRERTVSNKNNYNTIYRIFLLIIFAYFFTINIITPYMGEDYALMPYYPSTEIQSLPDAIVMIVNRIVQLKYKQIQNPFLHQ